MMKAPLTPEPTRGRHTLLGLIFALTVITYFDRLCISAAMPSIAAQFGLTPEQRGWVFSASTFAYAVVVVSSVRLGDWFGARFALTRIVCWCSAFNALTGA